MLQRNKILFVFAGAKEEVVKLQNFIFLYLQSEGLLHLASEKSQKVRVPVAFALFILLC